MSSNGLLPDTVLTLGFDWTAQSSTRSHHENFIQSIDWSATAVGPPAKWPAQLRETVDFVLADPNPAAVMWGDDLTVRNHMSIHHTLDPTLYYLSLHFNHVFG